MEAYVRLPINWIYPSNKWALMLVYQTWVLLRNFNSIPKIINRILDDGEIYQGESIVFKFFCNFGFQSFEIYGKVVLQLR